MRPLDWPTTPALLAVLLCVAAGPVVGQTTILGAYAIQATANANGTWSVIAPQQGWTFSGGVGVPATHFQVKHFAGVVPQSPATETGAWDEMSFDYSIGASLRTAAIRLYAERPVALFSVTYKNAAVNTAPFPVLTGYPAKGNSGFRHLSYSGLFAFRTFDALGEDSPAIFFDQNANTFVLSPASDYMLASVVSNADSSLSSGISGKIPTLSAGMTHRTLLTMGQGINSTVGVWGQELTDLAGKHRPANDVDVSVEKLSYWTDNGATYYYNPGGPSYADTLLGIRAELAAKNIDLGSMQLDSWWYPKGPEGNWTNPGGIWLYREMPGLFQPSLQDFAASLGIPLITHARWIDAKSPLRQQYQVSGNAAVDPAYWADVAAYLQSNGVGIYEQDWLGTSAQTNFNLTDPYAFLDGMAAAMESAGINMQYCMAMPGHFLQSVNYSNLTSIRAGQDGFGPTRWTEFLYASRLASALGIWPFADVLMSSSEPDLLLATLSAGPVGIGDPAGSISGENLRRAVRPDGVIVKPDVPATPDDSVIISDAFGVDTPMVASTYTSFDGIRAVYIVAYQRAQSASVRIDPSRYGITTQAWLYDTKAASGRLIDAGQAITVQLAGGTGYWELVPVGRSGLAFLGDKGNFVALGKKRISALTDDGRVDFTVDFAAGEKTRTVFGYSPRPVQAVGVSGTHSAANWNSRTQMFTITVHPDTTNVARLRLSQTNGTRNRQAP